MALKVTLTLEMPMFQYLLYLIVSEKPFFPGERKETKLTCRPTCSYLAAGKNDVCDTWLLVRSFCAGAAFCPLFPPALALPRC